MKESGDVVFCILVVLPGLRCHVLTLLMSSQQVYTLKFSFISNSWQVLQRVGKADKTKDEVYKDNIASFQRQQASCYCQNKFVD